MKAEAIVNYCVILISLAGVILGAIEIFKKYFDTEAEKYKQRYGKSDAVTALERRVDRMEEQMKDHIEEMQKNEERYLNLLEKFAVKLGGGQAA